ncbi:MAG: siroheme synthase CysG [Pseudomonadales bacterium]|nr:siroheme synthase CysG [Pseudomonadales bacterium]
MELLPIFWNIRDRRCVVVGGGEIALRKANLLLRAGAHLDIVAESFSPAIQSLTESHPVTLIESSFQASHLKDACLVVAATDNDEVNFAVSEAANELDLPVNVVDQPHLCSFIMPAIVDRSPLVVAISSGGTSPVLTRMVKELNESQLPTRIDKLARLLGSYRAQVKERLGNFSTRLRFWETVLEGEVPELVYSGQEEAAHTVLSDLLQQAEDTGTVTGEVYLVGAGPGDPDLLTLRALRLMHKADVVLYDRLVSPAILQRVRPDAEKTHVGKQHAKQSTAQTTINQLLVDFAQAGKRVLRLKGGDPFIFGRGGEELTTLAEARIPFQIVPGITAATGCAAYAGIPLTHRDYAHSVRFLPGHLKEGENELDWGSLLAEQQTLVFYMSLVGLPTICEKLMQAGMDKSMPVAVIQQGTMESQKVIVGELGTIVQQVKEAELQAPTLTIMGNVVKLRDQLSWYD